jgi:rhodanese-related sulfurtransferase
VTPEEAARRQEAGALILDVREPDEWQEGHIAGAKHVPLGSLQPRVGELDPNGEIIAVCHSGVRSNAAVLALRRAGFGNSWNLAGGMLAWERRKLPIER